MTEISTPAGVRPEAPTSRIWAVGLLATGVVAVLVGMAGLLLPGGAASMDGDWLTWVMLPSLYFLFGCIAGVWPAAWAIWGRRRAVKRGADDAAVVRSTALNAFAGVTVPYGLLSLGAMDTPVHAVVAGLRVLVVAAVVGATLGRSARPPRARR